MEWMLLPLKRYAEFSGRSRRKEFWMFFLFYVIGIFVANLVDGILGLTGKVGPYGPFYLLFWLGTIVPYIAVGVRRMHDQDRSGWWIICPIANIIFLFIEGTKGPNRFGPDPKDPGSAEAFA